MTNTSSIALINKATTELNRYFSLFIFVFGTIGNVLNVLILFQRTLRSNPCASLFLFSSIANLIVILSGLTTRVTSGWAADLTDTMSWLCKLRTYVLFVSRTLALWLILFATVDRWLLSCTNVRHRQLSSLKNVRRGTISILLCSSLLYVEILYCYEANQVATPIQCYGQTRACEIFTNLSYVFVTVLIPILSMILFGTKTISNIHRNQHLVQPFVLPNRMHQINRVREKKSKKTDRYLLKMLFVQVFLLILFTVPEAIQNIYFTFTSSSNKSQLQNAVEKLIFNFLLLLTYLATGMPFYIYILCGGKIFRQAIKNLLKTIRQNSFCFV